MKTIEGNPTRMARASKCVPKADTMSASKPTRAFDRKTNLKAKEASVLRDFVERGKTIEKSFNSELLALATKVKAIFASKAKAVPVIFEGRLYKTFEIFVEAHFPICGRTMRRWLAKEGKTDARFANKPQPNPPPDAAPAGKPSRLSIAGMVAEKEARIRLALGYPVEKALPEILVRAYDAGWRQGYQAAQADADMPKGRA